MFGINKKNVFKTGALITAMSFTIGSAGFTGGYKTVSAKNQAEKTEEVATESTAGVTTQAPAEVTTTAMPTTTSTTTEKEKPATTTTTTEKNKPSQTTEETTAVTTQTTTETKNKQKIENKKLIPQPTEEDDLDKREQQLRRPLQVRPVVYHDHRLEMKQNKEMINGFIYFNQTDPAWNDNGYQISRVGCGPTSMAVVISSLTDKWVTPVDTAAWAYAHGYYSYRGSVHALIPTLSAEYGLKCEGVGRDSTKIREALRKGNPVVALMGPGHFTRSGHFMVLVDIDDNDMVAVADVSSRNRSNYKYALSDIFAQSKNASSGGPFWVVERPEPPKKKKKKKKKEKKTIITYEILENASEENIKLSLEAGKTLMILTDRSFCGQKDFIYLTQLDNEGNATIMDTNYENISQRKLAQILQHRKEDFTGISTWEVIGADMKALMPLSRKTIKEPKEAEETKSDKAKKAKKAEKTNKSENRSPSDFNNVSAEEIQ